MTRRIQAEWKNWRDMSGVLCDKRMPMKLKGKVYRIVVRPTIMSGRNCAKEDEQGKENGSGRNEVAELDEWSDKEG